jgi:hypothetical protein
MIAAVTSAGSSAVLLGCDGSVWDLLDRRAPVRLRNGLGGLHLPKVSHQWATTARRSGRTWKGAVTDARAFTMNVVVGDPRPPHRKGPAWRALDGQFWEALSTDELATLVINGERSRAFRLDEDQDLEFDIDPALQGRALYPIACIADRPEWLGKPVTQTWTFRPDDTTNFYGDTAGVGPPLYIAQSSLFATASVSNPGDLPAPAVWTATGPAAAFRVGVDGHVIEPPFALQSGDQVILDTEAETIMDPTGNSLWPLMGAAPVDFAAIPHGDEVPLAIGMDTPGPGASISISLTPRFRRAWGSEASSALALPSGGGGGSTSSGGFGDAPFGDAPFGD